MGPLRCLPAEAQTLTQTGARRCPRECPKQVAQLITRCKAVDARQRPSAREVYDALTATPEGCVPSR